MNQYDLLIVGAGFAGIYTAWAEARKGRKIALIEASDKIGGNLNSVPWNGYWLDNGTHNFDIRTEQNEAFFLDILRVDALIFENQDWASTMGSTWTYGFEFPDFYPDFPETARNAMGELETLTGDAPTESTVGYLDWYRQTYGSTLADAILPMVRKYTASDPSDLSVDARESLGAFNRLKLGPDADMVLRKEASSFWDSRLAVTLDCGDPRFLGNNTNRRFAYPASKGLTGFCEAAETRLCELGVDIFTSCPVTSIEEISADVVVEAGQQNLSAPILFWSLPEIGLGKILGINVDLTKSATPVGTAFFAFEVQKDTILGPDYLHDYAPDRLPFRYNKAGVYSGQTKSDGHTYVTCEIPAHPARLKNLTTEEIADQAWEAMLDVGYLKPDTDFRDRTFWGHPVAFTLPKIDWRIQYEKMQNEISSRSDRIIGIAFGYRGRAAFMSHYNDSLSQKFSEFI